MRKLVQDFSTHPLLPGSVLGSVIGDPKLRQLHPLDYTSLINLNKMPVVDIAGYFQNHGLLSRNYSVIHCFFEHGEHFRRFPQNTAKIIWAEISPAVCIF